MGFVQTRGIEELDRLEGIKGGKIPALDFNISQTSQSRTM